MGYYSDFNRKAGTTIVVNTGNAGSVFYSDKEFWSSDACFSLYPHNGLSDRYLFHFVLQNEPTLKGKIRTGAMPTIDVLAVETLRIPLPPLPVQQEIVRILDNFTELTAELTAELAARRKQYEHYKRDIFERITTQENSVPLKEVATFSQGIQVEPKDQFLDMIPGRVRFLRIVDFVSENEPPRYIVQPNAKYIKTGQELVMIRYGASAAGKVFMMHSGAIANNMFKINLCDKILPRFAMHYLSQKSIYALLNSSSGKSTMPAVNFKVVGQISIPIISHSEQKQIIDTLDRFDALCNDLTSGLPAEIAARQKQYEYYRDKLLTFKKLEG